MEPIVLANLGFLNKGVSMKEKKIWGKEAKVSVLHMIKAQM